MLIQHGAVEQLGPAVCMTWQSARCPTVLQQIVRQQFATRWRRPGQRPLRVISVSWNPLRAADAMQTQNIMFPPQSEAARYHPSGGRFIEIEDKSAPVSEALH